MRTDFTPQSLYVAIDRAVIEENRFSIRRIHQLIAVFHHAGARGQCLQDQKFGDRQLYLNTFPAT